MPHGIIHQSDSLLNMYSLCGLIIFVQKVHGFHMEWHNESSIRIRLVGGCSIQYTYPQAGAIKGTSSRKKFQLSQKGSYNFQFYDSKYSNFIITIPKFWISSIIQKLCLVEIFLLSGSIHPLLHQKEANKGQIDQSQTGIQNMWHKSNQANNVVHAFDICDSTHRKGPVVSEDQNWHFAKWLFL